MKKKAPPTIVNVCIVRGVCPANCKHCPVGIATPLERKKKFGYGFTTLSKFEYLCNQILNLGKPNPILRIHGVGEPTLWPDLGNALKICAKKGLNTWLFTIGSLNQRKFIDSVKNASIIEFSINAFSRKEFSQTKRMNAKEFDNIIDNIKCLSLLKQKNGTPNKILVSRVQSSDTIMDRAFVDYWLASGLVDDAFIRSFHDYGKRIFDKNSIIPSSNIKGCLVPTSRMNIDAVLGFVVRCFNELFASPEEVAKIALDTLSDNYNLYEIWSGSKMNKWRENIFLYPECSNCRSCQPFNSNTSEKQLLNL